MKIVTIGVPEPYIKSIAKLVGKDNLYPSRSELVRVAIRDFLAKELKLKEDMAKYNENEPEVENFDHKNYVRVPIENGDKTEYNTYKIIGEA